MILSVSLVLLLANLGNQCLWQDEAQTALVSKTILTDGVPRGYDGKNFFSQEGGAEYGKNYIWRWHTWLPFYVLAGFYKIFGVNTFVSRLPFALFGFGTILLIYYFCRILWRDTHIPHIAAGLLAISVPFLILSRQCRYYSMAMFFSVLALFIYVAMLNRKRYAAVMLFIASTLLFHTQHFYIMVLFSALLLHAALFGRHCLKGLLIVIVATVIVNGPWLVWLAGMHYSVRTPNPYAIFRFIKVFSMNIFRYVFPFWLLGIMLVAIIVKRVKTGRFFEEKGQFLRNVLLPIFFVFFNIVFMTVVAPVPYFRYIAPSVPLLIMLIAVIVNAAVRIRLILAVLTVALLLITSQISDYIYEITHDFKGPCEGIVSYLKEHGRDDDIVAITYDDMVLKFYTNMKIIGGLTGDNIEQAKNARWVIIRKYVHLKFDAEVRKYLLKNVEWSRYRKIVLDYPDTPWENRESPDGHLFRSCTDEDKVVIFERMN